MAEPASPCGNCTAPDVEEGPLWSSIKRQLYSSEVSTVKRLVGEAQIRQNRLAWDELRSLRQMLADFQQQNDELEISMRRSAQICVNQHGELLKRQSKMLLESLQGQAEICKTTLKELLPLEEDQRISEHILVGGGDARVGAQSPAPWKLPGAATASTRPSTGSSTRPSSSSGSSYSGRPESPGLSRITFGRSLGYEELAEVAEGIREELEAEHASLMGAIEEQTDLLEAEYSRRTHEVGRIRGEPSTAQLQRFAHKLQDLLVSPGLKTLACSADPSAFQAKEHADVQSLGGASARRLKALIAQRRKEAVDHAPGLVTVPEVPVQAGEVEPDILVCDAGPSVLNKKFDPFFDDPFV